MVKYRVAPVRSALAFPTLLATPTPPTKMPCFGCSAITGHCSPHAFCCCSHMAKNGTQALVEIRVLLWSNMGCSSKQRPDFPNTLLATPTPPTKMSALAAVQPQDTAHHMHSLLLSHGNEWNISFGRYQGAPMVNCELL